MKIDELFIKLSKEHGVSVEELKAEMQKAIDYAYVFPNSETQKIPCSGDIPTVDEFLLYVVNKLNDFRAAFRIKKRHFSRFFQS